MKLRYKISLVVVAFLIIASLYLVQSYALWLTTFEGQENILSVGCFDVALEELSKPISLNNTYPMSDQKGLTQTPYKFTIKNTCNTAAEYTITLNTLKTSIMDKSKIKFAFTTGTDVPTSGVNLGTYASVASNINTDLAYLQTANVLGDTLNESIILQKGVLKNENDTATFNLYLWVDQTAGNEVQGQKFVASVNVLANAVTVEPSPASETIASLVSGADTSSTDVYTIPNKTSDSCTYTLAYDGTDDNNLRYVGANPCNYIKIDEEYWRIIGVMNNIDDGTGKKETRIKLRRAESIGGYSYYKSGSGTCYEHSNKGTISCDFSDKGLKQNLKVLIDDALWSTGTEGTNKSSSNGLTNHWYVYERSNDTGKSCTSGERCTDTIERTTSWIGKVALMYPSDYGYATSGGNTSNRTSCLNKELSSWGDSWNNSTDCTNNNWLKTSDNFVSLLTPHTSSSSNAYYASIYPGGSLNANFGYYSAIVYPSVYLISSVSILSGEGTPENPYTIGLIK